MLKTVICTADLLAILSLLTVGTCWPISSLQIPRPEVTDQKISALNTNTEPPFVKDASKMPLYTKTEADLHFTCPMEVPLVKSKEESSSANFIKKRSGKIFFLDLIDYVGQLKSLKSDKAIHDKIQLITRYGK